MPQQLTTAVENNFTKGLITESTGLNFPENAATDTDNCTYTLVGDVLRRQGFDIEINGNAIPVEIGSNAVSTYKWNNAGGDGLTQIIVVQVGSIFYFYVSSAATTGLPLSARLLPTTVDITRFTAAGGALDITKECQFADGNGYLFIYHPNCDPVYIIYSSGDLFTGSINVRIRDFSGTVEEGVAVDLRPTTLSIEHNYNLLNQGWISGNAWSADSTSPVTLGLGSKSFTVASGIPGITGGQPVTVFFTGSSFSTNIPNQGVLSGTVTSYVGTTLIINVNSGATAYFGLSGASWTIAPRNTSYLSTWNSAAGNYPSNADVWWYFKNASGDFDPATTLSNVSLGAGHAPSGHYILSAFNQDRATISGIAGLTEVSTTVRPKTGTWFQGRVWYAGADAQQSGTGDAGFYTWTESIYFSQIVNTTVDFGNCFQVNDPTSENLFDLLPTDGGVIQIQGCGSIYKLFPIQNGLLVFAGMGIWFITGSQGIGFTANDYTITKISSVQSISGSSFVNVQGLPYFWNEEGIYSVQPSKDGGLTVEPITVGTILSYYNNIPLSSKKHVRGDYHPIDYVIQWIFRSTEAEVPEDTYKFDRILNYNTYNKAFYPYSVTPNPIYNAVIIGINYVAGPGGSNAPSPVFKYLFSFDSPKRISWADEHGSTYRDWFSFDGFGVNYNSYFVTGYKIRGQAIKKFQPQYIQVWSRVDDIDSGYKIQGLWNYSINRNSGKWSGIQNINLPATDDFSMFHRRHKIRGSGFALQFKVISQDSKPFDIVGWSVVDTVNAGT